MPNPKRIVTSLDEIISSIVLGLIILLTLVGVLFRYIVNRPIAWQEEVSVVLMVWLVFLGSSVVAKKSTHIRIDTLTFILLVLGLIFYYTVNLTLQTQKQTTILKIPYRFVYCAAPISILLVICHTSRHWVQSLKACRSQH